MKSQKARPDSFRNDGWNPLKKHTVADALREAAQRLRHAAIDEPRRNAEELLSHVLRTSRETILAHPEIILNPSEKHLFDELIEQRASRIPLQHILGYVYFMDFKMRCDRRALIPRPETELLVETVIELIGGLDAPVIADICAGSGNIAIALARAIPSARILAVDISERALELATGNARDLGVADRITFLNGDLCRPIEALGAKCDMVCSNPPYVSAAEYAELAPEVRLHEPPDALIANEDGLEFYRRLISESRRILKHDGYLVMEMPDKKFPRILELLDKTFKSGDDIMTAPGRFIVEKVIRDCAGIDRILAARFEEI